MHAPQSAFCTDIMLSSLLIAVALAPTLPQQGTAPAPSAQAPTKTVSWGCNDPRWLSRKAINKQLGEIAGYELYELLWKSVEWLTKQPEASGERAAGTTAIVGLAMLGTGSNPQTGLGKRKLLESTAALAAAQDEESGAIGNKAAQEFLLDHTLALLTLSENYFSLQVPDLEVAPRRALTALLAARGADGLWHVAGKPDGEVDPLVTALAGYALFGARAAKLEVPDEALEKVFDWTSKVGERTVGKEGDALEREDALLFAGALCARTFVAASLDRSLAQDAVVRGLAAAVAAQVPPPPSADETWESPPARLAEADFAFLASLGLFQSDNVAFGRCNRWLAAMLPRAVSKEGEGAGAIAQGDLGRFPPGAAGTTALRVLAMQNCVRELSLGVFAQ